MVLLNVVLQVSDPMAIEVAVGIEAGESAFSPLLCCDVLCFCLFIWEIPTTTIANIFIMSMGNLFVVGIGSGGSERRRTFCALVAGNFLAHYCRFVNYFFHIYFYI